MEKFGVGAASHGMAGKGLPHRRDAWSSCLVAMWESQKSPRGSQITARAPFFAHGDADVYTQNTQRLLRRVALVWWPQERDCSPHPTSKCSQKHPAQCQQSCSMCCTAVSPGICIALHLRFPTGLVPAPLQPLARPLPCSQEHQAHHKHICKEHASLL